ncbi:hypothetical protein, partial [uncultured Roseovarius sp.]|uniref:hypothetical protein n=1 Tax=uncultured Roseovarius sp. TaxID=293344 RepID=UPI0025EAAA9E
TYLSPQHCPMRLMIRSHRQAISLNKNLNFNGFAPTASPSRDPAGPGLEERARRTYSWADTP